MKYIRTKDGIFTKCKLKGYGYYWVMAHNTNPTKLKDLDIIKQADTIDELCDEFVLIRNGIIRVYPIKESLIGYCIGDEIYGAIWTEWGLKYVAKMNEKGELELL